MIMKNNDAFTNRIWIITLYTHTTSAYSNTCTVYATMLSVPGSLSIQIAINQTQHQASNYRVPTVNVLALVKLTPPPTPTYYVNAILYGLFLVWNNSDLRSTGDIWGRVRMLQPLFHTSNQYGKEYVRSFCSADRWHMLLWCPIVPG